jgi:hypothetical protein
MQHVGKLSPSTLIGGIFQRPEYITRRLPRVLQPLTPDPPLYPNFLNLHHSKLPMELNKPPAPTTL